MRGSATRRTSAVRTRIGWKLFCALALSFALLGGCGESSSDADRSGGPGASGEDSWWSDPDACRTDEAFFEDRVWAAVAGAYCVTCHSDGGVAATSNLVLSRSVRPDYLDVNFERMADIAQLMRDGESVLLLKPLGELNHGGGRVLQEDSEEICEAPQVDDLWRGVVLEPPHLTLRRAAILLLGRLPNEAELAPLREEGDEGLAQALDLLMQDAAFADRIAEVYRDVLWTDHYLGGNRANNAIHQNVFPNRRWYDEIEDEDAQRAHRNRTNTALARQPLELIRYIVAEGLPFSEILTADYVMVNDYSAMSMGLGSGVPDLDDPESLVFRPAELDVQPTAGVLSLPVFLHRFPSTPTNRNRHRAFIFYDRFLATDILALADRPIDATLTEIHNPTLNDYQCTNCHTLMDPVAGLFQDWGDNGMFRVPEEGWFPDLAPPGFEGRALPSIQRGNALRWLADQTIQDPRFALATVNTLHDGLIGRAPLRTVDGARTEAAALERRVYRLQRETLLPIADAFAESDFDIRVATRELLLTPFFRASGVEEGASREVVHSAGRRELLGPDDLHRKIVAVTGYPWTRNLSSAPFILSNFRLLYGGLDWNVAVSRLRDPNGVMLNIADRAAMQHACVVVPRDFAKRSRDRILMPHVEPSFTPVTPDGFEIPGAINAIRENIQHLHAHILGEELPLDHEEIDATLELFLDVWAPGAEDRRADEVPRDLPWSCRATSDFWTGDDLAEDRRVTRDEEYTIRAWIAVVAYLLSDFRFLYE